VIVVTPIWSTAGPYAPTSPKDRQFRRPGFRLRRRCANWCGASAARRFGRIARPGLVSHPHHPARAMSALSPLFPPADRLRLIAARECGK